MRCLRTSSAPAGMLLTLCLLAAASGCSGDPHDAASSTVLERIKAADRSYATAWLANDREQVMSTLTADAVLVPSGVPVLDGTEAIRGFWWPEGSPPTTVTAFTLVQRDVDGRRIRRTVQNLDLEYLRNRDLRAIVVVV